MRTDNNPLTYILTTPNLEACGHRWVASLAQFNFKIEYLKGTDNKVADVLSRIETRLEDDAGERATEVMSHHRNKSSRQGRFACIRGQPARIAKTVNPGVKYRKKL